MIQSWCAWLNTTSLSEGIRYSVWTYPILHMVHILSNALLLGTIAFVDLRLIGAGFTRRRVTDLTQQLLPWTWAGWVLMFASGSLIFSAEPLKYYGNNLFRAKLALMAFAGLNALVFHGTVYRGVAAWDEGGTPPRARLAGALSLLSWIGIVTVGRAIGYFT